MKPADRYNWIESYLREHERITHTAESIDILHDDFVAAYIEATDSAFRPMMYGAHKCPQLARDLTKMWRDFRLNRFRTGIEGMAGMGFPKWVHGYRLSKNRGVGDLSRRRF